MKDREALQNLWIKLSLHKQLKDKANKLGLKLSELVETIITNYLEKK